MDNLGDWLYIIILAIAGISSLFSSSKKKKKRPTDVLGQPNPDNIPDAAPKKSFWEMLEELQQEEPTPQYQPEPQPAVAVEKRPETLQPKVKKKENTQQQSWFQSHSLKENQVTGRTSYTDKKQAPIETEIDHYLFEDESFHDLTELRKAIIYTEILNRKY